MVARFKVMSRDEMAAQTILATIARELRKYYVTLLIVDQRPPHIYDEVMSQLGAHISGWRDGRLCAACWCVPNRRRKF